MRVLDKVHTRLHEQHFQTRSYSGSIHARASQTQVWILKALPQKQYIPLSSVCISDSEKDIGHEETTVVKCAEKQL